MSDSFHPSNLTDYSARTWVDNESATAAKFQGEFDALETNIANLNDAVQDVNNNHSGATAPATSVAGQIFYNTANNQLLFDPDAGGADQPIPRVLTVDVTAVGATGAAATMIAYTIPANTLKTNGQILRITAWGTKTGAASSAATIQVRTAAAAMASLTIPQLADAWTVTVLYIRTGAATEDVITESNAADAAGWSGASAATAGHAEVEFANASNATTGTIAFDLRATAVGLLDTITQEGLMIELLN